MSGGFVFDHFPLHSSENDVELAISGIGEDDYIGANIMVDEERALNVSTLGVYSHFQFTDSCSVHGDGAFGRIVGRCKTPRSVKTPFIAETTFHRVDAIRVSSGGWKTDILVVLHWADTSHCQNRQPKRQGNLKETLDFE